MCVVYRDKPTRRHLKNVYSVLSLTMLAAGVGAVAFFFMGHPVSSSVSVVGLADQ